MKTIIRLAILAISIPILLTRCENSDGLRISEMESGQISIQMDVQSIPNDVWQIKGFLIRPDFDTIKIDFEFGEERATALVEGIPVGKWTVKVDAYNSSAEIIYSGSAQVEVLHGQITPVHIHLSQTGSLEIIVTWGEEIDGLLFKDDFSDDLSKWDIVTGTWQIKDGQLLGIGHGGNIDGWIYAGDNSWTDYEVSTRVYFNNGDVEGNAEIVMRSTGHWQNEYRIEVFPHDWRGGAQDGYANDYVLSSYKNGVVFNGEHIKCPFPITDPADILITAIGNQIKLYINGTFVDSLIDPNPLANGRFGLGVVWTEQSRFDDVVVIQR